MYFQKVNIVKTKEANPSEEVNTENANSEDVTYNIPTTVKRKIDELKALRRKKRFGKVKLVSQALTDEDTIPLK